MASTEKIRVIITGATGMVGEGVMLECLQNPLVESVLIINRKPSGFTHPKLKEIVHTNFYDISPIADQLEGYDACYFCLGVSSVGMKEDEYAKVTYTLTIGVAEIMSLKNPDMVFCYVSGVGTDSTEKGRLMWARVKGKTENDLQKLPFKAAYAFRPGMMKTMEGQKNLLSWYKYLGWLYPVLLRIWPDSASTMQQVAQAMIHATVYGYEKRILEVPDIKALAGRQYV